METKDVDGAFAIAEWETEDSEGGAEKAERVSPSPDDCNPIWVIGIQERKIRLSDYLTQTATSIRFNLIKVVFMNRLWFRITCINGHWPICGGSTERWAVDCELVKWELQLCKEVESQLFVSPGSCFKMFACPLLEKSFNLSRAECPFSIIASAHLFKGFLKIISIILSDDIMMA